MAGNPDPAARTTQPVTCNPNRRRSWTDDPSARHPDVVGARPSPITARPNVSWSGGHRLGFNANRWRSSGHDHLASRTGGCYFLRSRSRCNRRWFSCAADQCQWNQHQQIRASRHLRPPLGIRLVSNSWLCRKPTLFSAINGGRPILIR